MSQYRSRFVARETSEPRPDRGPERHEFCATHPCHGYTSRPRPRDRVSLRIEANPGELPLRHFLHGVADALAPEAARADPAERIGVEPEPARLVDPERADPQLAR